MLRQITTVLLAAVMAVFGFAVDGASAFPVQAPPSALQAPGASPLVVDVRHVGGYHGRPVYRPGYRPGYRPYHKPHYNHYYGRRCGYYSSACRYRYGNYWYPYQWWLPGLGAAAVVGAVTYNSRHKNWCAAKYRSYNPRNNTYVNKNGVRKKCVSPYY